LCLVTFCSARYSYEKKERAEGGRENTSTKKLGCPAQIVLKRKVEQRGEETEPQCGPWVLSKMVNQHNHILPRSPAEMKAAAFTPEMRQVVTDQCKAGVRFHAIRTLLQSVCEGFITEGQLKGYISQWKTEYMDGRGDLQTMRDQLRDDGYHERVWAVAKSV
jgi:hypothetical protein